MAAGLHISISAETIAHVGPLAISNSMFTSVLVSSFIIIFAILANRQLQRRGRPTGLQNFAEFVIEALAGLINGVTGSPAKTRRFFPFIATFFIWILLNNWFGLFPGVGTIGFIENATEKHATLLESTVTAEVPAVTVQAATTEHTEPTPEEVQVESTTGHETDVELLQNAAAHTSDTATTEEHTEVAHEKFVPYLRPGTADLNTTLALALITVIAIQGMGVSYLGIGYFGKFFNFSSPIMFFVGILELISEFGRIISFAFRLFGNVFAGEVLLTVISFLVPIIAPMPFYGLEIFVGFIQALVFSLLSVVLYNMATASHDEH